MYNEHFGFTESPFNVTPDSRFFFVNPCYEEAYATLSYGIDARKGFVIVTGEPGTGKTTLLKRLTCSLDSNVQAACIFDPHLSFIELLRLTLGELGLPNSGDDRLTMMEQLYDHLVQQLEHDQIVCLMIDEAQSLSMEMLEELRLLSNLETDTEKLIQIVFVGQPEFEEKLDRPELVQLKQRVSLRCRLEPLQAHEVGLYVDSRLKTVQYMRPDLFDDDSIERIALYSKGIPRLINVICDNALLIAFTKNRAYITSSDIDEAAHELQLTEQSRFSSKAPTHESTKTVDASAFQFRSDRAHAANGSKWSEPTRPPEFEPYFSDIRGRPAGWNHPQTSYARCIGLALILSMTAGTMLLFSAQQNHVSLPAVRAYVERLANFGQEDDQPRPSPAALESKPQTTENVAPQPLPVPTPQPEKVEKLEPQPLKDDSAALAGTSVDGESAVPVDPQKKSGSNRTTEITEDKRAIFKNRPVVGTRSEDGVGVRKMEIEIYKAIHDRAITGVQVLSINDGVVFLDGRVATPRQKLATVRAAMSVPGVKSVRDRITIDY